MLNVWWKKQGTSTNILCYDFRLLALLFMPSSKIQHDKIKMNHKYLEQKSRAVKTKYVAIQKRLTEVQYT